MGMGVSVLSDPSKSVYPLKVVMRSSHINFRRFVFLHCAVAIFFAAFVLFDMPSAQGSQDGSVDAPIEGKIDFAKQVLPILSGKCFLCHGPDSDGVSDLRLDSREAATADLGGYHAIDLEHPDQSVLLTRIHSADEPMPPLEAESPLTDSERTILDRWVLQGAEYASHWSFVVPRFIPPHSDPSATGSNAIDAYIVDELSKRGVKMAAAAEKWNLARRVALTLTGLPPSPELLERFLLDHRPSAYEELVDALLASPAYGEHQARYWLDAIRYGDTHGLHLDNRRGIYPYRDWVVKAFNDNLPWDDFILWQLAGDLLQHPTMEQQVATGFVRMNPSTAEGGAIAEEFQAKNSFDRVESFGTIFLGLSLTCARCHTHKYDPILHEDYFRLMAYFNNTTESPLDGNKYDYKPVIKAPANQQQWLQWQAFEVERSEWLAGLEASLSQDKGDADAEATEGLGKLAARWSSIDVERKVTEIIESEGLFAPAVTEAATEFRDRASQLAESWSVTLVAKELEQRRPTRLLQRGEYDLPSGEPLEPAPLPVLNSLPTGVSNNRLGLAQWLLSPEQPLTARVLVNRFWLQVFGEGLVRTPEEFGLQGQHPTHPELLDFLALELQQQDWNLKQFLKMLVMTQTFRQSSAWRSDLQDPENIWWARGPGYRLDAEVIRDMLLLGSGLYHDEMGGEGFKPFQPPGMWEALAHPHSNTKSYQEDATPQVFRRSVYLYWKRTSPPPIMALFDAPSREASCVKRSRSNTPLQSLALLNEPQRVQLGVATAVRLVQSKADDRSRLDDLFKQFVCRVPTAKEAEICLQYLEASKSRFEQFPADAQSLVESAAIPGETVAEGSGVVAAWAQLLLTIMASDAVIMNY